MVVQTVCDDKQTVWEKNYRTVGNFSRPVYKCFQQACKFSRPVWNFSHVGPRVRHTYFTHSYLLKGEDMLWCIPYHCPYTLKHILLYCIDLRDTRIKYYTGLLIFD